MSKQPATSDEVVIRYDKVCKSFGDKVVLKDLDLEVRRGETLAIMGPSGIGKSVTLRHAVRLLKADAGTVTVEGHDMATIARDDLRELRRRMGYLFQEGALINWLSTGDNVSLPLRENTRLPEAEIRAKVDEVLELVHLPGTYDLMPPELSGGMRKRVGLARALVTEPEIIFFDEPNTGLDPEISMSINHLMRELNEQMEITSIVITHLVSCILVVADRVVLLDQGHVVAEGTPEDFVRSDHPRIRSFLARPHD
ncbi:MAG: ATP-binding cassette domain-containing protein [Planctomycetota bacterium]|nr:ATP-binding cassette domain-containing protein [Planctomycetota bacterium]